MRSTHIFYLVATMIACTSLLISSISQNFAKERAYLQEIADTNYIGACRDIDPNWKEVLADCKTIRLAPRVPATANMTPLR